MKIYSLSAGKDFYVTLKLLGQECSADLSNVASAKFQELRGKLYDAVSFKDDLLFLTCIVIFIA